MTKTYAISSGKGGVGKTVTTINIGASLADLDNTVTLIDGNLAMGDMGLLLGLEDEPVTLHDVLAKDANMDEAVYEKENFQIVPSGLELKKFGRADPENLDLTYLEENSDYILIDTPPGLSSEVTSFIGVAEKLLSITTPNISSVLCTLKTCNIAKNLGTPVEGTIINKIQGKERELNPQKIEKVLGNEILARIPEDENIEESAVYRNSLIEYSPDSSAVSMYRRIAETINQE